MHKPTPTTLSPRWLLWLPVGILLCVWALQVTLTQTHDLTPWKGAGFGMFSVIEQRNLDIEITDTSGQTLTLDMESLKAHRSRLVQRTRRMPSEAMLCHLAEAVAKLELRATPFEETPLFDRHQAAWWRVKRAAETGPGLEEASPRWVIKDVDERGAEVNSRVASMRISVRRLVVDVEGSKIHTEPLGEPVRWREGRCEVGP